TITLASDNLITFAQSGVAVLTTSGGVINVTSDADDNATGETRINANSVFTTGAGAGNITLTGDVTSGTPDTFKLTLTAGVGNLSVTDGVSQLDALTVTSAADVTFDSSVTVTTFTQQAGTGTTTFDALTADSISITTSDLVLNGAVEASVDALDITVDTIEVGDTVTADAGINLQTATSTQAIELGGGTDTGTNFTLTEAELQFLSSTGVVTIGSASYTGDMTVDALDISSESYDLKLEGGV
ncbi:hypothetical protein, partial [Rubinisphaera sp. JC750]|uniref:hypothetical protein n=1 Tax=Rubinisphaera sp. JC750 TaxID=2898658 RepID=UPI001F1D7021